MKALFFIGVTLAIVASVGMVVLIWEIAWYAFENTELFKEMQRRHRDSRMAAAREELLQSKRRASK